MNKKEVCEYLGKSKRTIETYVKSGRLPVAYVKAKNGNTAVFERADVDRCKDEYVEAWRTQETFKKAQVMPDARTVERQKTNIADFSMLARLVRTAAALPASPETLGRWLDLEGAAKYSNLPKAFLIRQARAGECDAVNVSGSAKREVWRFRVRDGGIIGES